MAAAIPDVSVSDQLAWEERRRPQAAIIALAAGALAIGAIVLAGLSTRDQPRSQLLDSLANLERPGEIGSQATAHVADFQYTTSHFATLITSIVMLALGLLCVGLTLSFLGQATRARRPQLPRLAAPAPALGGAIAGVGLIVVFVSQKIFSDDLLAGTTPPTVDAVRDHPAGEAIGSLIELVGLFMFALGAVLVSLNAMRAGLLTRTMGILGMFAGGAIVIFGPSQPLLPLWTMFLAPLFLGRWMGGQPPAWKTGQAEPWPSGAQMREERLQARGAGGGKPELAEPDPEPVEERAAAARPHPSSKKRKRKRRS